MVLGVFSSELSFFTYVTGTTKTVISPNPTDFLIARDFDFIKNFFMSHRDVDSEDLLERS